MVEVRAQSEVDEIAFALVQALARQDTEKTLSLCETLAPLIDERPELQARLSAWKAQAHRIDGDFEEALTHMRSAIALAQQSGEAEAVSALRRLKAEIISGKAALQAATQMPLPDTILGRALSSIDQGDDQEGGKLARQARLLAQSEGNHREEVLALLALARIPGQEDSAIRAAHAVADRSDDKNLVTAVARAAKMAKVNLPPIKL